MSQGILKLSTASKRILGRHIMSECVQKCPMASYNVLERPKLLKLLRMFFNVLSSSTMFKDAVASSTHLRTLSRHSRTF